jgi:hypothetical protein
MLEFSDNETDTNSDFEMEHVEAEDTVTLRDVFKLSNESNLFFVHFPGGITILCKHCKRHTFREYSSEEIDGVDDSWEHVGDGYHTLYGRYYDWDERGTTEATLNEKHKKGSVIHNIYDYLIQCKKIEDSTDRDLSTCCHDLLD